MSLDCRDSGCPGVNGESGRLLAAVKPPVPPPVPTFPLLPFSCVKIPLLSADFMQHKRHLCMKQLQVMGSIGYRSIPEPGLALVLSYVHAGLVTCVGDDCWLKETCCVVSENIRKQLFTVDILSYLLSAQSICFHFSFQLITQSITEASLSLSVCFARFSLSPSPIEAQLLETN